MPLQRIAICTAHVPFVRGGAEILVDGLANALTERGYRVEIVRVPYKWYPKPAILQSCLAWRMIDLTESNGVPIDAVICTKFPSYLVAHPRKVVWLVHQFRQIYDLYGTEFSDFSGSAEDQDIRAAIQALDDRALGETPHRFAISANVAQRLEKYNGLAARPLHPPPIRRDAYWTAPPGEYILSVGRLDTLKRVDLFVQALAQTATKVRGIVVGEGPAKAALQEDARRLGIADRIEFRGWVDDDGVIDLYARSLGVYFAPFDEDYGYITVEAFLSRKPVVTTVDSGGALEFVRNGVNGHVCRPNPTALAAGLDRLAADPARAAELGQAGRASVEHISWDRTVETLLGDLV